MPKVAISIIHYENSNLTNQCVDSIIKFTQEGTYHIIIVDNNSPTVYTRDIQDTDITIIRNNNKHNVSGINLGLYHALYKLPFTPEYVVTCDNDIIYMKDWLPPLIKAMEKDPQIGIVGGKQWHSDMSGFNGVGVDLMGTLVNNLPTFDISVVWMQGSFHMYRAEMMRRIGLHDTRYEIICSDSDYCLHANDRGWKVKFIVDCNIVHLQNASYGNIPVSTERSDKQKLIQKWCGLKFNALLKVFPISILSKEYGTLRFTSTVNSRPAALAAIKHFGNKKIKGAEVGVRYGINAESMLCNMIGLEKLYLIDNDKDGYMSTAREQLDSDGRVQFIENDSVEAAKELPDESLDFVYIDADHSYESVTADIKAWLPKIKKGGIIAGHDYIEPEIVAKSSVTKFEVMEAVDDYFTRDKVNNDRTDWWVIKDDSLI